jgi:hypothetical protein
MLPELGRRIMPGAAVQIHPYDFQRFTSSFPPAPKIIFSILLARRCGAVDLRPEVTPPFKLHFGLL